MALRKDETVNVGYRGREAYCWSCFCKKGHQQFCIFNQDSGCSLLWLQWALQPVKAFAIQERAEQKLQRALIATGHWTRDLEVKLRKVASNIQKVTTLGDEQALGMMASLLQIGRVAPEQLEKAVITIQSISQQSGRAVERIARTFSNQISQAVLHGTTSIGELEHLLEGADITRLRALKKQGDRAGVVAGLIDILNEKFKDGAKVAVNSTDRWIQLGNIFGDVKEELGGVIHVLFVGLIPALEKGSETVKEFFTKMRAVAYEAKNHFHILGDVLALPFDMVKLKFHELEIVIGEVFESIANQHIKLYNFLIRNSIASIYAPLKESLSLDEYVFTSEARKKVELLGAKIEETNSQVAKSLTDLKNAYLNYEEIIDREEKVEVEDAESSSADAAKKFGEASDSEPEESKDLSKTKEDILLYKAMLAGVKDAELAHTKTMLSIAKERKEAQKIISENGNLEEAQHLLELADLKEEYALQEIEKSGNKINLNMMKRLRHKKQKESGNN